MQRLNPSYKKKTSADQPLLFTTNALIGGLSLNEIYDGMILCADLKALRKSFPDQENYDKAVLMFEAYHGTNSIFTPFMQTWQENIESDAHLKDKIEEEKKDLSIAHSQLRFNSTEQIQFWFKINKPHNLANPKDFLSNSKDSLTFSYLDKALEEVSIEQGSAAKIDTSTNTMKAKSVGANAASLAAVTYNNKPYKPFSLDEYCDSPPNRNDNTPPNIGKRKILS